MTPYRERHLTNEYFGRIHTYTNDQADAKPRPAPDEPQAAESAVQDGLEVHPLDNLMRKELVAIADANNIPNYGTKAQLLERLKDRGVT